MPLSFRIDDPAARGSRLQTLGLGSACLPAPLVASGRALVQLRVPAVDSDLAVGGLVPLCLGLSEPVRRQRRATNNLTGHLDHLTPRRLGGRSQPLNRGLRVQAFAVDQDLDGLLDQQQVLQGPCNWSAGSPLTRAAAAAASRLATSPA